MKNLSYVVILLITTLLCTNCAFNRAPFQDYPAVTEVQLNQANWRIIGTAEGYSRQVYVFGIGGLSQKSLKQNAIADMYKNANLEGTQVIINISTALTSSGLLPFYASKRASARGTIIEFLQENGEPVKSIESPCHTISQRAIQHETKHAVEQKPSKPTDAASLAKLPENKAYIMLLLKTNMLKQKMTNEAQKYFDLKALKKEKAQYSIPQLQQMSAEHDKVFEKFSK